MTRDELANMARIEIGQKFGKLTAVELLQDGLAKDRVWACECECGNMTTAKESRLKNGHKKSCGCLYGKAVRTHGMTKTRLHKIWSSMHERCEREKHSHFKDYGGRGICVCDEWSDFVLFKEWALQNGYCDTLTIDRVNPNGNYEPSNCRWVTMKEQANNKRTNHFVSFNGETHTIAQWSEITGINKTTIRARLRLGHTIEEALTMPVRQRTKGYRPSAKMDKEED